MSTPTAEERLRGGLFGLLVGDALGVPYEFQKASELPPLEELEMDPPPDFRRTHAGVPPGSWSDDGAQALCLLETLLFKGFLDLDDFARRLRNWWQYGYMAAGGRIFDVGLQTTRALGNLDRGVEAAVAGPADEFDNGNGSLMRVLPLALWHRGSDRELFDAACQQSLVTHGHPRSQICCGLYCLWARAELLGSDKPYLHAVTRTAELLDDQAAWTRELEVKIEPLRSPSTKASGYVVDCLHAARFALEQGTFEAVVKTAVSLGDDTDTTAAVAGGIAGVRFGVGAIPERWLRRVPDREVLDPIVDQLVERALESSRMAGFSLS